jgi:catechol 2,3-dioxygenase-like lactoylglutathione lyase family enzyme
MKGYVTLGTNDLYAAARFYEKLLESIGIKRKREIPNHLAYFGDESGTELAVIIPADGKLATPGNGMMVALRIDSREKIRELHALAIELGGTDEGAPGPRGTSTFWGAYFRDLDGNKLVFFTD